jgi:Replication protein
MFDQAVADSETRVPTSLDPQETNPHAQTDQLRVLSHPLPPDVEFRHSGWLPARRKIRASFDRCRITPDRIDRFDACGSAAWVLRDPARPDTYGMAANYCHDRFCTPCATARSHTIATNLRDHLNEQGYRLITLTLRGNNSPLADQLDRLYASFTRLRRRKLWQACISGGAAFLELTWSGASRQWHPHLHVIAQGSYIPQNLLRDTWKDITGDSFIVDVRYINDLGQTTRYVAKYAAKPHAPSYLHRPDLLDEAIIALGGRRLCLTFGSWRGFQLNRRPDPKDWKPIAPLNELIRSARHGNDAARHILQRLTRCDPNELTSIPDDTS